MKQTIPINTLGGLSPCITAHYHKAGGMDFSPYNLTPNIAILEMEILYDDYNSRIPKEQDVIGTITTCIGRTSPRHGYKIIEVMEEAKPIQVAQIYNKEKNPQHGRIYSPNGILPTLTSNVQGGCHEPKILEPVSCAIRGRNLRAEPHTEQHLEFGSDVANCLTSVQKDSMVMMCEQVIGSMQSNAMRVSLTEAMGTGGGQVPMIIQNAHGYNKGGLFEDISSTVTSSAFQYNNYVATGCRIRKLTPRECFRLMGVDDADIDRIDAYRIKTTLKNGTVKEKPIPKSQKYKMAGNSIVVDVLYHIFRCMFIPNQPEYNKRKEPKQLSLFD